jgi:hypothetical protein
MVVAAARFLSSLTARPSSARRMIRGSARALTGSG